MNPPYPGQWQPRGYPSYGYPAGESGYMQRAPRKRIHWPFVVAASILALASIAGGAWILLQPKSYEAIAKQCENTSSLNFLALFTGFSEIIEEHGDPADEFWDEVPTFIRVSGDSSSLNVYDRSRMSLDALELLDGAAGSSRDDAQEFIDQWNGMRDLAIMGAVGCIHDELNIPDSVERRMLSTRALDGTQELVHSGTRIMWSYHPSQGMDVLYERE
ncbi:hypothetical protein [Flaviflexus huanghaiensis]|uniref:hypothetical protein n=1 Tax=Flaviflexus huanghaiensis TaxID=1111473 RepID=UPI0015FD18B0|nr:hypothetical protein [Flaviflexus huanghaiensis]